ncbi:MAG: hypothetical protein WBH98_06455 [Bacteroidales bacterium]
MNTITCNIKVNELNKNIDISGLVDENIIIDYSDDIDFTELVTVLGKTIDKGEKVNVVKDNSSFDSSDKLNLILSTLANIFEAYNKVIDIDKHNNEFQEVDEQRETDTNCTTIDDNYDLPF